MTPLPSFNHTVFDAFPVLETPRLQLRNIELDDAYKIFEQRSSERIGQFIARPLMQTHESAVELVEKTQLGFQNKQVIGWAGELKSNGNFIGTCGYNTIDFQNLRAEIGGEMTIDAWGKGFAKEAVQTILQFGFNTMNLWSVEAKVHAQNRSAIFVLEQMGFEKEAHFKNRFYFQDAWHDLAVYTLFSFRFEC